MAITDRLTEIEAEIAHLREQIGARLSAIGEELRRAEARDEWAATQLRAARQDIRTQTALLDEISVKLTTGPGGFSEPDE